MRIDRIQMVVPDRDAVAERWRRLLDAQVVREDEVGTLGARRSVLGVGRSEVELLEPAGTGPVADFAKAWGGTGLFAAGCAVQEPERLRATVEYLAAETLWQGRFGWYAAIDLSSFAERDWQLDWAVDLGLLLSSWPRRWRLGLEVYDGRAPLGEFFQSDQRFVSFGLWLDL